MTAVRARVVQTTVDQIVSSACLYSLIMLMARALSPREFGLFLIGFGVLTLASAIGRSMFGALLGMDLPSLGAEKSRDVEARSVASLLIFGSAVGAVLATFGALAGGRILGPLLVVSVALPLVLLLDLVRYGLVARGAPVRALLADTIWVLPVGVLVSVDLFRGSVSSPGTAAFVWATGLVGSLGWLHFHGRIAPPRFRGLRTWLISDPRRLHLGLDASMAGLVPVGNGIGAAAVSSAVATAAVRGSAAMFAPLATLAMAVSLGAVPEAKRRLGGQALRFLLGVTGTLMAVSAAWGTLLLAVPDQIGEEILGSSWAVAEPLLPFVAAEYLGLAMWTGATAMLRYSNATRTALRIRLLYAPTSLVLPVVALAITDDVRAFVATLAALALLVGTAGIWLAVRRILADT